MKIKKTESCKTKNLGKFDAGLCNISNALSITTTDDLNMFLDLGFYRSGDTFIRKEDDITIYINIRNGKVVVETQDKLGKQIEVREFPSEENAALYLLDFLEDYNIDIFASIVFFDRNTPIYDITAAVTSKSLSDKLLRVKSSNIWSYGMNVKKYGDKLGNLMIQFKGADGSPDDVYQYFDVPVKLWNKFITAPSKGHFFWKYIRNAFKYRKLTGDKRGKLPNAVN